LQQAKHNLEELYTQLADSETNYRNVFEHSLQGIFQLSPPPDSRFLAANDALARILGYPDTSRLMAAHQAVEVQLFADSRQRDTLFLQLAQSGAVHNVEVSLRRTDSSEIWVMLSMFALSAGDGATYYQGFLVDITDKRQKEQAEREKAMAEAASRMKSEFLANMSHEIRTPMNAVLGMTQLALRTELDGKQRNYLDKAHRSAQSLLGILNDILDFSKIEAGKLELEHVRFSLREVLDNVLSMQRFTADEKGLSLTLECAPGTPDVLVGDPLRLGQVLLNLTSNALKFTPAGGRVSVLVAGGRDAQAAVQLRLSVADTGIGIGPEQRELLFRSFSQGDVSTTRQFGGTGLGLAISRMLVGLMGGEIWVESEPGRGSTFSFTAHLVCPDAAGEPLEHGVEAATERLGVEVTALRGSRVLLVEDNEINLELAEEVLLQNGLLVTRATNGLEALEALDEGGFDGVLMDCQMPLMDGCEATRRIRRQERFRDLPIIAMTASAMRSDVEKALAAGMNAHLAKPIDIDALLRVLAAHLRPGMPSVRNEGDPDRPERPPPAVDLAALPGVDAQIGLASVAGNEALYRRLLQKFVEMDRYPAGQLRGYLDDGDYSALRQAAHALKGVSANLGMTRLQRYSADLEKACAQQGSDTATVLERMLAELDRVFAGIRRLQ
jgi:PAS domain S-box-containing protein